MEWKCLGFEAPGWVIDGAGRILGKCESITVEVGYIDQSSGILTLRAATLGPLNAAVSRLMADPICTKHFRAIAI